MSHTHWESKNLDDINELSPEFAEMLHEANNGTPKAQHAVGMWHEVRGNCEEAIKWYKKATDQGYPASRKAYEELLSITDV